MFNDDPYLLINLPHPERDGFATQEEMCLGSIGWSRQLATFIHLHRKTSTMATVLEPPTVIAATRAGQRLQQRMAAVRLSFTWLGVRKTLTPEQKAQAAEPFGAQHSYLSAGKKLLDTS